MALWICIIAIVVSILAGWKFKLNTGVIAIGFAFVIGICVMGMKASDIINFWPTTIVFYLLSIALFFNYATENGTILPLQSHSGTCLAPITHTMGMGGAFPRT